MDDKTFWQIAGTLITAIVGFCGVLIGGFATHLLTLQRADRELLLKKAEELLGKMDEFCEKVLSHGIAIVSEKPTEPFDDSKVKAKTETQILVDLYFPTMREAHHYVYDAIDYVTLAFIAFDYAGDADHYENRFEKIKQLGESMSKLSKMQNEFRAKLVRNVDEIRTDSLLRWVSRFYE